MDNTQAPRPRLTELNHMSTPFLCTADNLFRPPIFPILRITLSFSSTKHQCHMQVLSQLRVRAPTCRWVAIGRELRNIHLCGFARRLGIQTGTSMSSDERRVDVFAGKHYQSLRVTRLIEQRWALPYTIFLSFSHQT